MASIWRHVVDLITSRRRLFYFSKSPNNRNRHFGDRCDRKIVDEFQRDQIVIRFVILLLIAGSLGSCCTSQKTAKRRIARMVDCNPSLINDLRDTVTVRIVDTIVVEPVSGSFADTLTRNDTLTHTDTNGIVTRVVVTLHDTITQTERFPVYIETICPPDTVFVDIERSVPCPDPIVVQEFDKAGRRAIKITWFGIGAIGGLLLFGLFAWAIGRIRGN